ncbi:response regulator [Clostridium sp. Sa3CUN1]|uniref:Stage 0 sporulation protein A homolog n=1 Tax=Clostridium gallinarum TaxID=2762246 RepID=A0ABR8Q3J0_9CLOT|nr:response regulator [Clostridium gallinarum]MBD7914985.1 response regulator [Clostridium gallinarum]
MEKNYCRVLIVEDEFIMRQGMKHMIEWEKEGFTIVGEATNGEEALKLIEDLKPNIVISDIVMPILNGVDFSKIVQKKYPEIQIIILSSYDNFEYVKDTLLSGAVDYILKPTLTPNELLVTLKKAVDRIPGLELVKDEEVYYSSIIEKYILGFEDNIDSNNFFDIFPNTCFRLLGINIKQGYTKNREFIKESRRLVEEFLINNNYVFIRFIINEEILLYLINYKVSDDKELVKRFEKYIENKMIHENRFYIITSKFNNISNVKDVYNNKFLPYLSQKFYYKEKFLLNTEDIILTEGIEKFDSNKYDLLLKKKDFISAINLIKNYIDTSILFKMDEYKIKNLLKNLLYNLIVSLESYNLDAENLRQRYFKRIDKTTYIEEFSYEVNNILLELKEFVNKNINLEEDRINEILEYIDENYNKTLELSDIAKAFNFNYYYLSYYFNNHCKEGFSEYLNRIRIEKACDLLKENKRYVSEISSMIGYSDHSYFCRVFKKITGYTPSNYRIKMRTQGVRVNEEKTKVK